MGKFAENLNLGKRVLPTLRRRASPGHAQSGRAPKFAYGP